MKLSSALAVTTVVVALTGGYLVVHSLTTGNTSATPAPPSGIDGPSRPNPPALPIPPSVRDRPAATTNPPAAMGDTSTVRADETGLAWAPATAAQITPGVQTYTGDGQCTANFVFTDDARNVYIGQAAHCTSTGKESDTNGCTSGSQPVGTAVTFHRGGSPRSSGEVIGSGELAYSSWISMQQSAERDTNTCAYNDFALVKLDSADLTKVNPTIPHWGGPVGIDTHGTAGGDMVHSYGNSSLRLGVSLLSPQTGRAHADDPAADGWSHALTSPTPGVPGDSGSAYVDNAGNALGTLSTLGFTIPIVNNIGDLSHELSYAQTYSGIAGLRLVLGTEPFNAIR